MQKKGLFCISDNEYFYLFNLYESIKNYGKDHKLFYAYSFGKLELSVLKQLLGVSETSALRFIAKQRERFIEFVQEQEIIWFSKFPFNNDKLQLCEVV